MILGPLDQQLCLKDMIMLMLIRFFIILEVVCADKVEVFLGVVVNLDPSNRHNPRKQNSNLATNHDISKKPTRKQSNMS